MRMTGRKQQ